jgi:hypothetical protein
VRDINGMYHVDWDDEQVELHSYLAEKGRGLELSELHVFDGLIKVIIIRIIVES